MNKVGEYTEKLSSLSYEIQGAFVDQIYERIIVNKELKDLSEIIEELVWNKQDSTSLKRDNKNLQWKSPKFKFANKTKELKSVLFDQMLKFQDTLGQIVEDIGPEALDFCFQDFNKITITMEIGEIICE